MGVFVRAGISGRKMAGLYVNGQTLSTIAAQAKVSLGTVRNRLITMGVRMRVARRPLPAQPHLTKAQRRAVDALIDGVLLGDGYMTPSGQLRVSQSPKRLGWLRQLATELRRNGFSCRIFRGVNRPRKIDGRALPSTPYCRLQSLTYSVFRAHRVRWYRGVKMVPLNVNLTVRSVAHWMSGDGYGLPGGGLGLCTDGFSYSAVRRLAGRLSTIYDVDARVYRRPGASRWFIVINRRDDAVKFANKIRRFMPACTRYKLAQVRRTIPSWVGRKNLAARDVKSIRRLRARGQTYAEIGARFDVSPSLIGQICRNHIYAWVA